MNMGNTENENGESKNEGIKNGESKNEGIKNGKNKETKNGENRNTGDEAMIAELLQHLDTEFSQGVYRMSVGFDEAEEEAKTVSRKCCNMYGRPATETVGLLDMYTDISAGDPDRQTE